MTSEGLAVINVALLTAIGLRIRLHLRLKVTLVRTGGSIPLVNVRFDPKTIGLK